MWNNESDMCNLICWLSVLFVRSIVDLQFIFNHNYPVVAEHGGRPQLTTDCDLPLSLFVSDKLGKRPILSCRTDIVKGPEVFTHPPATTTAATDGHRETGAAPANSDKIARNNKSTFN